MDWLKGVNWVVILGIVVAVETQIGNGTMSLANMFPIDWIPYVKAWAANLGSIGAIIMSCGAFGRTVPTPTVPPAMKAAIITFLILGSFMLPQIAQAKPVTKTAALANPALVIQQFTVDDLNAALADATSNNDQAAMACYTALLPVVTKGIANPLPSGLGAFQALQKARDAKALLASLQSPTGPLAALNMACAPLVLDVQNTLIQLGIITGAVAATGGVGLTLPIALPFPIP